MADYSFTNIDQSATDGSDFLAGLPAHNEYINYINRWKFLINSYLGGAHYKMGNTLQNTFTNHNQNTLADLHRHL